MKWYWEEIAMKTLKTQVVKMVIFSWFLSIGMPYYQGRCNTNHRQVSSAQTNQTQVLIWDKPIITTLALVDLGVCSLLGWIALETSFSESPRPLKMEFGVKSYGIFCEVTYAVSKSCGSATNFWSSARAVVVPWVATVVPHCGGYDPEYLW